MQSGSVALLPSREDRFPVPKGAFGACPRRSARLSIHRVRVQRVLSWQGRDRIAIIPSFSTANSARKSPRFLRSTGGIEVTRLIVIRGRPRREVLPYPSRTFKALWIGPIFKWSCWRAMSCGQPLEQRHKTPFLKPRSHIPISRLIKMWDQGQRRNRQKREKADRSE